MNYLAAELTRYHLEVNFRHVAELRGTNTKEFRKEVPLVFSDSTLLKDFASLFKKGGSSGYKDGKIPYKGGSNSYKRADIYNNGSHRKNGLYGGSLILNETKKIKTHLSALVRSMFQNIHIQYPSH
jgi:hypothetical protein